MSLTTRVRILRPLPIDQLWAECQQLIGAVGVAVEWDRPSDNYAGARQRRNLSDQGLPALMAVDYCIERPLDDEPDETTDGVPIPSGPGPFFAEVMWDTSCWYEGPDGESCGDLHARLAESLDTWLLDRYETECWWNHEYDGSWNVGAADLGLLAGR